MEQLAKLLQGHLELDSTPGSNDNIADMGLDSLLAIELGDDIEKMFSVSIDLHQIDETSTFGDLARLSGLEVTVPSDIDKFSGLDEPASQASPPSVYPEKFEAGRGQFAHAAPTSFDSSSHVTGVPVVSDAFEQVRLSFDKLSQQEGFANFWRVVYPSQERLVLAYTANAFKKLGCDLGSIPSGPRLASISILGRHNHLLERMYKILSDGGYISTDTKAQVTPGHPSPSISTILRFCFKRSFLAFHSTHRSTGCSMLPGPVLQSVSRARRILSLCCSLTG